jgi:undecaprenyl-diphosphatase
MSFGDIDAAISLTVNRAAGHSASFDRFVIFLTNSDLVKGGLVMAVLWTAWIVKADEEKRVRAMILAGIAAALLALLLARVLAYAAPMRVRPLLAPNLHFIAPLGLPPQANWTSWSSFPSDHAALFFALSWPIWSVSRRVGAALTSYIIIAICLPRLYIGIHYFTDLFAGAVIGLTCSAFISERPIRQLLTDPLLAWAKRRPASFYFLFSLLTFQIATLFWDLRTALSLFGFAT